MERSLVSNIDGTEANMKRSTLALVVLAWAVPINRPAFGLTLTASGTFADDSGRSGAWSGEFGI
jgi:hypothetical protein